MTALTLTVEQIGGCLERLRVGVGAAPSSGLAIDLAAVRDHIDELHREVASQAIDVANLRSTLTAVAGGRQPTDEVQLVVTFRPGQVEVSTDRSMPLLVSSSYPIVEG